MLERIGRWDRLPNEVDPRKLEIVLTLLNSTCERHCDGCDQLKRCLVYARRRVLESWSFWKRDRKMLNMVVKLLS